MSLAYGKYLNEARARLSRRFLECDVALQGRTALMQREVVKVLRNAGQLGNLSDAEGSQFLQDLADRVPKVTESGDSEIRYALKLLADFQLSYRGMLQHRVRACLNGLGSENPSMPFPQATDEAPSPGDVREMLEVCYNEALAACRRELTHALSEPSEAVFAIVEEFTDRVVSAAGALDEWRVFYQDVRTEVWPGQFAALAEETLYLRQWAEAVEAVAHLAAGPQSELLSTVSQGDAA
jgi:hypothetical protein